METKRFDIITEADARVLEPGSTVRLAARGHITPLAADTLRERRITVIGEDMRATPPGMSLVPAADVRRLAIGSDHAGFDLKAHLIGVLRSRGLQVQDAGTLEKTPVDYPDVAAAVAKIVARQEADAGIVIDGAGLGSAIAANKMRGIRAAMCLNETLARYSREHNGANVLDPGRDAAQSRRGRAPIVLRFIETPMREPRYIARLEKIARLERS